MTNLDTSTTLLRPVFYDGELYFTSHYFHRMYLLNSQGDGKYGELFNFNKLIRSIETYPLYVERGDIVELEWKPLKEKGDSNLELLKPAFEATGYRPIMLINATAQVALTHHLDDEISKQTSVRVNADTVTREAPQLSSAREAASILMMIGKEVARLPGINKDLVMAGTMEAIHQATGLAVEPIRKVLPAAQPEKIGRLNPTELGKSLGLSGKAVNKKLADLGLQRRLASGEWELTEFGVKYGELVPFARNGHSSYQILWTASVGAMLRDAPA